MGLATELEASLKEFLTVGLVDLHENGARTSFGSGVSWEVRGDGEKPLLHLWAERFNVTRRVLATIDNCLTFALLWLSRVRLSRAGGTMAGLRIILPKNSARTVAHRFGALDHRLNIDLYEHEPVLNVLGKIDPRSVGNVDTWLVPARESESLVQRTRQALDDIIATEPNAISLHPVVQTREVWLRFRGLPFARGHDGRVYFGIGEFRRELTATSQADLKQLLRDLARYRHRLATDTRHELYRAQPERWLESLVREDVTRVDAVLDPRFVYSQVFASSAGEHGILDLLTVTLQPADDHRVESQ